MPLCFHRSVHNFAIFRKVWTLENKRERTLFGASAARIPYSEGLRASSVCWPPQGTAPRPPRQALGEGNPLQKARFIKLVPGASSPYILSIQFQTGPHIYEKPQFVITVSKPAQTFMKRHSLLIQFQTGQNMYEKAKLSIQFQTDPNS